jgi:hypothetical protein
MVSRAAEQNLHVQEYNGSEQIHTHGSNRTDRLDIGSVRQRWSRRAIAATSRLRSDKRTSPFLEQSRSINNTAVLASDQVVSYARAMVESQFAPSVGGVQSIQDVARISLVGNLERVKTVGVAEDQTLLPMD